LKLGESFEAARFAAKILVINVNGIHIDNFLIENPWWTLHNFGKGLYLNGGGVLTAVSNKLIATHESTFY